MHTLSDGLRSAGYKASVKKNEDKERTFNQCECGAILNKYGLCRVCEPDLIKPRTHVLRKKH